VTTPDASHPVLVIFLNGEAKGTYTTSLRKVDSGATYKLNGAPGSISPVGEALVTGQIHIPGVDGPGQPTGTLKLTAAHGRLALKLTGSSFRPIIGDQFDFSFNITRGTHGYSNDVGTGTVDVTFAKEVTLDFQSAPPTSSS
jgi:hypothetical protein